jgi:hypothetical protein
VLTALICLLGIGLAPAPSRAQETREHELPKLEEDLGARPRINAGLEFSNRFVANADFGEFEANSYQPELRLRVSTPISKRAAVQLVARGRILIYDFDGRADLGTGSIDAPFDNLNSWTVRLQGAYRLDESWTLFSDDERWSIFGGLAVRSRWEQGSNVGDGLQFGGSVGVTYRLGSKFDFILGVTVGNKLEDGGVGVGPVVELGWQISEKWSIRSLGLGLELNRTLTPNLTAFARARLEGGIYRLAYRGSEIGAGTLRVRQLPVALGLRWNAFRHFRFRAAVGVVAYHQLRLRDWKDITLGERTAGPSAYVMLRIDMRP